MPTGAPPGAGDRICVTGALPAGDVEGVPLGWEKGTEVAQNPTSSRRRTQWPPLLHSSRPRQKIFKEKALPDIENYMFENHDQLRQAATECMCNMVLNKEVRGLAGDGQRWRPGESGHGPGRA